jgi:hypothetical protein
LEDVANLKDDSEAHPEPISRENSMISKYFRGGAI